jgi:hypothetical protein
MSAEYPLVKSPSTYMLGLVFKGFSAFFVGVTASLIFHTFFNYSTFGFVFIGVVFSGLVLKFLGKSTVLKVFLFDVAFLFLLLLLKTYITLAPNM